MKNKKVSDSSKSYRDLLKTVQRGRYIMKYLKTKEGVNVKNISKGTMNEKEIRFF